MIYVSVAHILCDAHRYVYTDLVRGDLCSLTLLLPPRSFICGFGVSIGGVGEALLRLS